MKKSELKKMYPGLSRDTIGDIITLIIAKTRNITEDAARFKKTIMPKEFSVFVEFVGDPIEIDNPTEDEIMDHTPTKDYLVMKHANVSEKLVLAEINEIIKQNRHFNNEAPVYEKVLFPKEYNLFIERFL